jgi:small ligand-binding sensory domain FIST
MMRAGVGLSTDPDPVRAAEEAASGALCRAGKADAALLLATAGFADAMPALLDAAIGGLSTRALAGATCHGVLGLGREEEHAVVALAISGLEVEPFLLEDVDPFEPRVGEELRARLGGGARPEDLVVLLPDPRGVPLLAVLEEVRTALAPAVVVGAGAADPVWDRPQQWCGREIASGGLAGLVLRGPRPPRVGVTQACRPITEPLPVTRAQGHWILELGGRPALDVYREAARGPLGEDLRRAASFVLAALPKADAGPLTPGGYLVRNVAGFALEEKAFAIPEALAPGELLGLVVREPEAARDDLKTMLGDLEGGDPAFGLYFDCCARGAALFGVPGLEAGYLERSLGGTPLAGMFGSCEIGPIGGRPELLTYTGVLALIDR